jgi:hypothetical protein
MREIAILYTYCFTVTMNNQITVTSKEHCAKTILEISYKYLTLCFIYEIKVLTFIKVIV